MRETHEGLEGQSDFDTFLADLHGSWFSVEVQENSPRDEQPPRVVPEDVTSHLTGRALGDGSPDGLFEDLVVSPDLRKHPSQARGESFLSRPSGWYQLRGCRFVLRSNASQASIYRT